MTRGPSRFYRGTPSVDLVRILHAAKKYPPLIGGDATVVAALRRAQERDGHEVSVLTYRPPAVPGGLPDEERARVHRVGPSQSGASLDRITLRRILGMTAMRRWARTAFPSLRPDVIHAHAVDVAYAVAPAARASGIPLVLTCHGVWFPQRGERSFGGRLEPYLIRHVRAAALTAVDAASVAALRGAGFDARLVPNGVDPGEFSGERARTGPFRFLFVGRHEPQKGIDVLLEAAAALRRGRGPGFRVRIVGTGSRAAEYRLAAQASGLGDVVEFTGPLPRPGVVKEYLGADALVLPSRFEGFPLAVLEAWAAGLPVVATTVGGVRDVCSSENAVLVPPGDPRALAVAMGSLLDDRGLGERLGASGQRLVRERFTWDAVSARYLGLYRSAIARATPRAASSENG